MKAERANHFTATLRDRTWLGEKAFQISLDRPRGFRFLPGQSITIVNGSLERVAHLVARRIRPV
jgi:hypothetical protein